MTGDHPITTRIAAIEGGILGPEPQPGEVVDGKEFRNFTAEERMEKLENIKVLARATPDDKLLMVQGLRQKRHVVACTCTNLFWNFRGTICRSLLPYSLYQKTFSSNRGVGKGHMLQHSSIHKVLDYRARFPLQLILGQQLLLTDPQLLIQCPKFHLLWVKLIVGTFSALALIIKLPSQSVLNEPPRKVAQPILTSFMLTNICIQALYQVSILLTINFKGKSLFKVNSNEKDAMILNTYIVCQVLSMVHASLSGYNNVIKQKKMLWGIMGTIIIIQVLTIEVLKNIVDTAKLDLKQWGACIAMAASSWLLSGLVRSLPTLKKAIAYVINWPSFKPKVD